MDCIFMNKIRSVENFFSIFKIPHIYIGLNGFIQLGPKDSRKFTPDWYPHSAQAHVNLNLDIWLNSTLICENSGFEDS